MAGFPKRRETRETFPSVPPSQRAWKQGFNLTQRIERRIFESLLNSTVLSNYQMLQVIRWT